MAEYIYFKTKILWYILWLNVHTAIPQIHALI